MLSLVRPRTWNDSLKGDAQGCTAGNTLQAEVPGQHWPGVGVASFLSPGAGAGTDCLPLPLASDPPCASPGLGAAQRPLWTLWVRPSPSLLEAFGQAALLGAVY